MSGHLLLLQPSANRVYVGAADALVAAELRILLGDGDPALVEPVEVAGVGYLAVRLDDLDEPTADALGRLSAGFAVYRREGDLLRPVPLVHPDRFDDDLVTIPSTPARPTSSSPGCSPTSRWPRPPAPPPGRARSSTRWPAAAPR